jgi:hypothetical protein
LKVLLAAVEGIEKLLIAQEELTPRRVNPVGIRL